MEELEQINARLKQLKEKLEEDRPVSWPEFPDIGLYKDQVISYMQRQLIHFEENGQITSAMLNNYIKDKLLPRADGKKYAREHLAGLTEICILKQVLTVRDTGLLLQEELGVNGHEAFYEKFREILDTALSATSERIDTQWEADALSDMALRLAIASYCDKLAAERLIEIIRAGSVAMEQKKTEKKPEKKAEKQLTKEAVKQSDKQQAREFEKQPEKKAEKKAKQQ